MIHTLLSDLAGRAFHNLKLENSGTLNADESFLDFGSPDVARGDGGEERRPLVRALRNVDLGC